MYPTRVIPQLSLLLLGCALPAAVQLEPISVSVRSHNRSPVEVYLLCGHQDARWLGSIGPREAGAAMGFPPERTRCVQGLNFFLVDREHNRGYWVGPMHLERGTHVDLVIEKYAGLSSANILRD